MRPHPLREVVIIIGCVFAVGASSIKLTAQGTVELLNRSASAGIDARVLLADGTGAGAGFTAQLYGGPVSAQLESLWIHRSVRGGLTWLACGKAVPLLAI